MTPIRVLIADDQELVRSALKAMLSRRADLSVVGEAADGWQAVDQTFALKPDLVVMDVRMPGLTGVEATERILRDWPHSGPRPRILVLTTFDHDEYIHSALRAGAGGFILKTATPDQLADAIRVVAAGEAMLAPSVTRRLIAAFATVPAALLHRPPRPDAARLAGLTQRELEVLILVAQGRSNAQIAEALDLTVTNVKSRINRILTRLGLENRVQAAILAYENGLLDGLTS
ncbi:response regulator [Sinosporangium siamense]|uniref:DNA-binding response regulator n=1 Tax=Sinosporangium siamense TaxID=1367973 RepID=A0A919VBA8_9ACTN|nr:response regulator transcription factor [Sinosporangium siamense]GII97381.1 DNA-binding response regulator [Sinosporangium siamense]